MLLWLSTASKSTVIKKKKIDVKLITKSLWNKGGGFGSSSYSIKKILIAI